MSTPYNQIFYTAEQGLTTAPKSIRIAIYINLVVTFFMPVIAMAISDFYLDAVPHLMVVTFAMALFVLYSKVYYDTTKFSLHPLGIYFNTLTTPVLFLIISYWKDWPLELIIAESVAAEMLGFTLSMAFVFIIPSKKDNAAKVIQKKEQKKSSNSSSFSMLSLLFFVMVGLVSFVVIMYFRFEGVIHHFLYNTYIESSFEYIFILLPLLVIIIRYSIVFYPRKNETQEAINNDASTVVEKEEVLQKTKPFTLHWTISVLPHVLNMIVPFIMYVTLYYVPQEQ
jgi:hypothetical protein